MLPVASLLIPWPGAVIPHGPPVSLAGIGLSLISTAAECIFKWAMMQCRWPVLPCRHAYDRDYSAARARAVWLPRSSPGHIRVWPAASARAAAVSKRKAAATRTCTSGFGHHVFRQCKACVLASNSLRLAHASKIRIETLRAVQYRGLGSLRSPNQMNPVNSRLPTFLLRAAIRHSKSRSLKRIF
jgi:hypothetical protein